MRHPSSMKRTRVAGVLAFAVTTAAIISVSALTFGAETDTKCWDEYDAAGRKLTGVLTPKGLDPKSCTPAVGCFTGFALGSTRASRLYVPKGAKPSVACTSPVTTTTTATTTTLPSAAPAKFVMRDVGSVLPTEAQCASWVRPMTENRPANAIFNATRGTKPNTDYPNVTGAFTGTTDEIIQWVACKWGIDEDYVRAQIVVESSWSQTALGDFTTDGAACDPDHPIGTYAPQWDGDRTHVGECPESVGLGQVRWNYHRSAFADQNAVRSSAYNLDYTYAVWRACFEGQFAWLNQTEGRGDYKAGDAAGCLGVWFAGRWYTAAAQGYIDRWYGTLLERPWEQTWFPPATTRSTGSTTPPTVTTVPAVATTTTAAVPATTTSSTTVLPTTTATTTTTLPPSTTTTALPSTTTIAAVPSTTTTVPPSASAAFVEAFTGNTGLDRFETGMFHRDEVLVRTTEWTGDHDMNCGSPDTQRTIHRGTPSESFYMCKDHLMTSVGDTSGYSIAWFKPRQTFNGATMVSWDVSVTFLGTRKWWEVAIVPASAPDLSCSPDLTACGLGVGYPEGAVVVSADGFYADGVTSDPWGWENYCFGAFQVDPEGCGSKPLRRTFTMTDNQNGTVTVAISGIGRQYTYPGSFPAGDWKVVFKDHNYTPDKDGVPVGHTWHWDNIIVQ
jgi:hypothetical protein